MGCCWQALLDLLPAVPLPLHRRQLGKAVLDRRKRAGFTQETLAEKADLSAKYIGEVERGKVNISVDTLARIARALRVRVKDLFDF